MSELMNIMSQNPQIPNESEQIQVSKNTEEKEETQKFTTSNTQTITQKSFSKNIDIIKIIVYVFFRELLLN
jgi:hypothetical protein